MKPTIPQITAAVAEAFKVHPDNITGYSHARQFAYPRFVVCALARMAGYSFPAIGSRLNRDHTTIMGGNRRAAEIAANDPSFAATVKSLRESLIDASTHRGTMEIQKHSERHTMGIQKYSEVRTMNAMQRLAQSEGQFARLPENNNVQKIAEIAHRESVVLEIIKCGPIAVADIAKASGYPTQTVRVSLTGLKDRREIEITMGPQGALLYGTPGSFAPPPPVEKYPGTTVVVQRSASYAGHVGEHTATNVRLPAAPWQVAGCGSRATRVAQDTQGRCVGENMGVK